jgi:6-phosphogluconate dehydrogenase
MEQQQYDFGMIGLGTMGRNLVFNINDHGYSVAGFDKDTKQVGALTKEAEKRKVVATSDLSEFIGALKQPRVIIMLVPAGAIVDSVIAELKPLLGDHDLLLDCGNSHFTDTDRRNEALAKENIHFMGVGVSGGEAGARYGPSIMPGGDKEAYKRVDAMLQAVSAKVKDEPCVTWLGPGSAGHYVKMVHNGIEYGIMQLISEVYHILKAVGGLKNAELHQVFTDWNNGMLRSYLVEITAEIFAQKDDLGPGDLVDMILDTAHQKGTGAWTSEDAMTQQVAIPVIDTAVTIRNISSQKDERKIFGAKLTGPKIVFDDNNKELIATLEQALYFAMITTYAQGFALMSKASKEYKYDLQPEDIARIWRGGCIIRAALLEDISAAYKAQADLLNLMLDGHISAELIKSQDGIRNVVRLGAEAGIPIAALMSALSYYDSYRCAWLPANLLQAQRDYFGAHTYERTDRPGVFHTHWNQKQ